MSLRVVGIDPSLTSTGVAIVCDGKVAELYTEKSWLGDNKKPDVRERAQRIKWQAGAVVSSLYELPVDLFVIEGPSHGSRFGKPHERAGLWWAIVNGLAAEFEADIFEVAPQSRAKYATGNGGSKKPAVYKAVKETYGALLGDEELSNHDEGDALLLAAMGARVLGEPVEAAEPSEGQLAALTGLREQVHGAS